VFARGAGYACAACSAPRERLPGTVVLGGQLRGPSLPPLAPRGSTLEVRGGAASVAGRAAGAGLRLFGVVMVGAGVLAATVAAVFVPMPLALVVAGVVGTTGIGAGVLLLRGGRRAEDDARRAERADDERRANEFVRARGVVSTGEVAAALGWSPGRAEEALGALAAREHVAMDVDADGRVLWSDPDAARRSLAPGARARVADAEASAALGEGAVFERAVTEGAEAVKAVIEGAEAEAGGAASPAARSRGAP
jgi:hypothetical protein